MACFQGDYDSSDRRAEEEMLLYVENLPEELNLEGIAQLFKSYGETCSLLSPPGAKYAFVGYKSYREAENAIQDLNGRAPLYLRVSFSKTKPRNQPQKYDPPEDNPVDDYPVNVHRHTANGTRCDVALGRIEAEEQPARFSYSVYPDDTIYNPYESAGAHAHTNTMWSRGGMTIDQHGKRHVTFGRGYPRFEIPEPHLKVEEHLGRVYEKRRAEFHDYGDDGIKTAVGKCLNCRCMTKLKCETCNGFYCSKDCQVEDWVRHKKECRTIPALVGDVEIMSRSDSDDPFPHVPRRPTGIDLRSHGALRRPKRLEPTETKNTAVHEASGQERHEFDIRGQVPNNGDKAARSVGVQNGISRMNGTADTLQRTAEALQRLPQQRPIQNDHNTDHCDRFHHRCNNENAISGKGASDARGAACKLQDVQPGENVKPSTAVCVDPSTGSEEPRLKSAQPASVIGLTRKDLINIAKEFVLERERRVQVYVGNQGPVVADSPESPPPEEQGIGSAFQHFPRFETTQGIVLADSPESPPPESQGIASAFQSFPRVEATRFTALADSPESPPAESKEIAAAPIRIGRTLPKDKFTEVMIIVDMLDTTFWVHKESDVDDLAAMMLNLNEIAESYPKVPEIVIGETYAVKYENFWHRVTVATIEPLVVFYIDYGNEEPPQSRDFRSLKDFPNTLPFAIRVRISNVPKEKPVNADETLAIKMIGIDEYGVIEVVVQEATARSSSRPDVSSSEGAILEVASSNVQQPVVASTPPVIASNAESEPKQIEAPQELAKKLPSLIDSLSVKDEGVIQVFTALNEMSYAVCVLDSKLQSEYALIYEQLSIDCSTVNKPSGFNPDIGEFVCGKRDEYWFRGYVFSVGASPRLALVDEARISPVQEFLPVPEQYTNICSFGAICTFVNPGSTLLVDESAQFRVTEIKETAGERVVHAVIVGSENLNNVGFTLKNWKPKPEQKGMAFAELKPNSEVCITAYHSERVMFVRSLDPETLERTQRIIQKVAEWAQIAPMLDGPPAIGQLVIAKYADGNFYRAIVTKLIDGKVGVSYVDYGNRENTTIDQLRMLSDELKEQKSCAAKVVLKDIKTGEAPTREVLRYLDILVSKDLPLYCEFVGIPSKDGVILTTRSAECINSKINEYLTPSSQKEEPSKGTDCYMLDDFHFAELGQVGKVVKAIVLHATDPPLKYVMSPVDQSIIRQVTEVMATKIHEYCESTKEPYVPRVSELCIAVYLGQWYRGVCFDSSPKPNHASIQFIDYGNLELVEHKDIRPITKEFYDVPGLGCHVTVKNLGIKLVNGEVPENIKARLDALIQLDGIIDLLILKRDDREYEVELPEVKKTLIAEGLV